MKPTNKGKRITFIFGCFLLVLLVVTGGMFKNEFISWYELREEFDSLGKNEQGFSEYEHRKTGLVFVSLPGGKFLMGSPKSDAMAGASEFPQHEVILSPFLIAKYEVTHADWKRVMGQPPRITSKHKGDNIPLERVRWGDGKKFCEALGLYLPTEAQWEYACRGGATTRFSFGDEVTKFFSYGWHNKNSGDRPHPVGEKAPNGFGIHDMHGNVAEWCEDIWDPHLFKKRKSRPTDPLVISGSHFRFLRGGAYYDSIELLSLCRSKRM